MHKLNKSLTIKPVSSQCGPHSGMDPLQYGALAPLPSFPEPLHHHHPLKRQGL